MALYALKRNGRNFVWLSSSHWNILTAVRRHLMKVDVVPLLDYRWLYTHIDIFTKLFAWSAVVRYDNISWDLWETNLRERKHPLSCAPSLFVFSTVGNAVYGPVPCSLRTLAQLLVK
jgi:hypothetical protein